MFKRFSVGKNENPELKDLVLVVKKNKGNVEDSLSRLVDLAGYSVEEEKHIAIFTAFEENKALSSLKERALKGEKGSTIRAKAFFLLGKLARVKAQIQPIYSLISMDVSFVWYSEQKNKTKENILYSIN